MATLGQLTATLLNIVKGGPHPDMLTFDAKLDSTVTATVLPGMVGYLSATGTILLGCAKNCMPLFLLPGLSSVTDATGASGTGTQATDYGAWFPVTPTGNITCLPATGAYELSTTTYVSATYLPNDPLTAATGNGATAGKLTKGVFLTNTICGIVSVPQAAAAGGTGAGYNGYNVPALHFWTTFQMMTP